MSREQVDSPPLDNWKPPFSISENPGCHLTAALFGRPQHPGYRQPVLREVCTIRHCLQDIEKEVRRRSEPRWQRGGGKLGMVMFALSSLSPWGSGSCGTSLRDRLSTRLSVKCFAAVLKVMRWHPGDGLMGKCWRKKKEVRNGCLAAVKAARASQPNRAALKTASHERSSSPTPSHGRRWATTSLVKFSHAHCH